MTRPISKNLHESVTAVIADAVHDGSPYGAVVKDAVSQMETIFATVDENAYRRGLAEGMNAAMKVLMGVMPCPECAQGKHGNCTFETLDEHDQMVQCPCMIAGHRDHIEGMG